jgi:hypothetical protein
MLDVATEYARQFRFVFNNAKSAVMVFGSAAQRWRIEGVVFTLGGAPLTIAEWYKYLGVEVVRKSRGRFNMAVDRLLAKCKAASAQLLHVLGYDRGFPPLRAMALWQAFCRPIVEYGSELWGPFISKTLQTKLESEQLRFAKRLVRAEITTSSAFIRREFGIPKLAERRRELTLQFLQRLRDMDQSRLAAHVFEHSWANFSGGNNSTASWGVPMEEDIALGEDVRLGTKERKRAEHKARLDDVDKSSSLELYSRVMDGQKAGSYLDWHGGHLFREGVRLKMLARADILPLGLQIARRARVDVVDFCHVCLAHKAEDRLHFVWFCDAYSDLRAKMCGSIVERVRAYATSTAARAMAAFLDSAEPTEVLLMLLGGRPTPGACAGPGWKFDNHIAWVVDDCFVQYLQQAWRVRGKAQAMLS